MRTVNLNDSEFFGNTSRQRSKRAAVLDLADSHPSRPGTATFTDSSCRGCGSSLAGRRESTSAGVRYVVDVYRCRCGRGRHVRRLAEGRAA
jgi:hypothetical protein